MTLVSESFIMLSKTSFFSNIYETLLLGEVTVRRALIVAVLVALCSALVGVTLVLKRFSFIGHGLSNVAFCSVAVALAIINAGAALADVMKLTNNLIIVLPVTIVSSILLMRTSRNGKINGDAAIAMISVGSMAIGYLVLNRFPSPNRAGDVCDTMFGSLKILTLGQKDVWICIVLAILVVAVFVMFYNKIFSLTFDEDFTAATGVKAEIYNTVLAVLIAVIIALAIDLVGTLLISALIIFPALSAMRVFKTFLSVTVCSVILSVICSLCGIFACILINLPVGSTIIATNIVFFGIFWLVGIIKRAII